MIRRIKVWNLNRYLKRYGQAIAAEFHAATLRNEWRWPDREPNFGEGRYVWHDGDWVRP